METPEEKARLALLVHKRHLCRQMICEVYPVGEVSQKKALEACSLRLRLAAEQKAKSGMRLDEAEHRGDQNTEASCLQQGHIVWAKFKGHPPWPSLISTKEEATAHGLKGTLPRPGRVPKT